ERRDRPLALGRVFGASHHGRPRSDGAGDAVAGHERDRTGRRLDRPRHPPGGSAARHRRRTDESQRVDRPTARRPLRGRGPRDRGTFPGGHPAGGERRGARVCRRPERHHGRDPGRRVSRKLQLLLFVCGSAVFAYLVARIGVAQLLADAVRTGSLFVPIVLLYGVVCACNAGAWWLSMADEPSHPPFWRTYAITVAGFSLNFMTPMVNVGGEPFKIAALAPWLGLRRAAGSVVIYQMLHTLGMLLSFLTAVMLGALLLPPHPAILASLVLAFVVLAALVLLLLTGHRYGGPVRLLDLLARLPLLYRLARRLL